MSKRIALTGGIACGKSLVAEILRECGIDTLDADDIVHELIPADERKRLAAEVFRDPSARRELEARIHPIVRARINEWLSAPDESGHPKVAIIPLLFEVGWNTDFDKIICVASKRETQIAWMTGNRGYSLEEAEGRLAAQMPVGEKARMSDRVIGNDGSVGELRSKVAELAAEMKGW